MPVDWLGMTVVRLAIPRSLLREIMLWCLGEFGFATVAAEMVANPFVD